MIDRLRELLRAATPGPWMVGFDDGSGPTYIVAPTDVVVSGAPDGYGIKQGAQDIDNAEYIAACDPDTIAELLDAHDRMAGALAELLAHHDETMNGRCQIADRFRALAVPKEENPDA